MKPQTSRVAAASWRQRVPYRTAMVDAVTTTPNAPSLPAQTRVISGNDRFEYCARASRGSWGSTRRLLALRPGRLADFITDLGGLERLRRTFPSDEITLVVSPEAVDLGESSGLADRILSFDFQPQAGEWSRHDVLRFERLLTEAYDLAIDFGPVRVGHSLLDSVRASLRAGFGRPDVFPNLDIALPVDREAKSSGTEYETFDHHAFASRDEMARTAFRIGGGGRLLSSESALVWGPYRRLRAGRYIFEPFLEVESGRSLMIDVALDTQRVCGLALPTEEPLRLPFTVVKDGAEAEFRLWSVDGRPVAHFSFYGGRLWRESAADGLQETEYSQLLVELIRLRLTQGNLQL